MITDRLKDITHIPHACLLAAPPVPKSAKIEITSRCNYKCQFCAINYRKDGVKDMDWELFQKITREMKSLGVQEIGLFYIGESFTNPDLLVKCIRFLKQELEIPYVFLTSNASIAFPDKVEACMMAGLDSLKWSCNAADDEQFTELVCVSTKMYEQSKANIKAAKKIRDDGGYKTGLYASSILYNENQPKRMIKYLENDIIPYVDQHYWLPLYTAGGQAKDKVQGMGMKPIAGNSGRLADPSEPLPCWTTFTAAHVMVDGKMTACCLDGNGTWVMGDLKTESFMEIWHGAKFVNLRRAHLAKDVTGTICEKCTLVERN